MNHLYFDEKTGVRYEDIEKFENEIDIIKKEFSNLSPNDAIWSFEDNVLEVPSNMTNINYDAVSLVDYYQNSYKKNIFDIFFILIEDMRYYKSNCKIELEK